MAPDSSSDPQEAAALVAAAVAAAAAAAAGVGNGIPSGTPSNSATRLRASAIGSHQATSTSPSPSSASSSSGHSINSVHSFGRGHSQTLAPSSPTSPSANRSNDGSPSLVRPHALSESYETLSGLQRLLPTIPSATTPTTNTTTLLESNTGSPLKHNITKSSMGLSDNAIKVSPESSDIATSGNSCLPPKPSVSSPTSILLNLNASALSPGNPLIPLLPSASAAATVTATGLSSTTPLSIPLPMLNTLSGIVGGVTGVSISLRKDVKKEPDLHLMDSLRALDSDEAPSSCIQNALINHHRVDSKRNSLEADEIDEVEEMDEVEEINEVEEMDEADHCTKMDSTLEEDQEELESGLVISNSINDSEKNEPDHEMNKDKEEGKLVGDDNTSNAFALIQEASEDDRLELDVNTRPSLDMAGMTIMDKALDSSVTQTGQQDRFNDVEAENCCETLFMAGYISSGITVAPSSPPTLQVHLAPRKERREQDKDKSSVKDDVPKKDVTFEGGDLARKLVMNEERAEEDTEEEEHENENGCMEAVDEDEDEEGEAEITVLRENRKKEERRKEKEGREPEKNRNKEKNGNDKDSSSSAISDITKRTAVKMVASSSGPNTGGGLKVVLKTLKDGAKTAQEAK